MQNFQDTDEQDSLLTPGEVAQIFRVDPKTVSRWADAGMLSTIRTLGGHRRFRKSDVDHLVESMTEQPRQAAG